MPITIVLPSTGTIGPGYQIQLQSSFIGPIEIGSSWIVSYSVGPTFETQYSIQRQDATSQEGGLVALAINGQSHVPSTPAIELTTGTPVRVEVTLNDPVGNVLDSGQGDFTWDPSAGWSQINANPQAQISGGLTEQEHTWLDTVQQAVQQTLQTATGAVLSTPIGSIIAHPDIRFLNIHQPCQTITGRGKLNPPGPIGFGATYGAIVTFVTVPPGMGLRDGASQEYNERIVQLVAFALTNDGSTQYIAETHDIHASGAVWLWQLYDPSSIVYDVTPGCTAQVCFLTVGG